MIRAAQVVVVILMTFLGPTALVAVASTGSTVGLHVRGNALIDAGGAPVVIHGVNISGTEFACAQGGHAGSVGWSIFGGQPEDAAGTIDAIKSWRANAVRIPLNEDCWLGINGINPAFGGASYRAAIGSFVDHLTTAGLYVIVDLHWSAPGPAVALSQQPMADADHAIAFWRSAASMFAAMPNVLFDLYNEPFLYASYFANAGQDAWTCWLKGCTLKQYLSGGQPYTRAYRWQTAGMQNIVGAVRATGARNVLIINGLDWADDDSGWLSHRPHDPLDNAVAGWHEYGGEQCAGSECWSRSIAPLTKAVPVVVGETGDRTGPGCTLTNLPRLLPWADSYGISYLAWTFNPWHDTHDVLIADWSGAPSACEGEYYRTHLASIGSAAYAPRPAADGVASPPQAPLTRIALSIGIAALIALTGVLVVRDRRRNRIEQRARDKDADLG
jgi:hypothetical protein